MRVLIADDERDSADLIAELVRLSLPCDVRVAYESGEALRLALETAPEVVVLDLYMPGCDGMQVAEQLHRQRGPERPFLIALTGQSGAAHHLHRIDGLFDRVFTKPIDSTQLIAALARLMRGEPRTTVPYDIAELFTRAVRQVVPLAVGRGLAYSFDYEGPCLIVTGDPVDAQCGLHRLLLGLLDLLETGFVMFSAHASLDADGIGTLVIEAAGTGQCRSAADTDAVLERMQLRREPDCSGSVLAQGVCPKTGAPVLFSSDGREGLLLRSSIAYPRASERQRPPAFASGQSAWLIENRGVPGGWLHRRLQRQGWRVWRLHGVEQALAMADALSDQLSPSSQLPDLVVIIDRADLSLAQARALQQAMPEKTHCILAVTAGSSRLAEPGSVPHYDLRVLPFSPRELDELGVATTPPLVALDAPGLGTTGTLAHRPVVLLVDDNEINRIIGRGLLEALGCEVHTAHDGLDAIDQCRQHPPQLVLMDLDMPVLPGLDATRRMRELQRLGQVAPFAIIAATADASAEARAACAHAGMEGFMAKPLSFEVLGAQLRRFTAAI